MAKQMETKRAYKFGVEIEISCVNGIAKYNQSETIRTIAEAINAMGVNANGEGLSHNVRRYWKVVTDGSCGYEVVSPVLYDMVELELVCKALKNVGAKVTKECGLHVHHDASDMSLEKIKNVYRLYNKHEEVLDSMMPESRRKDNNRYSKGVDNYRLETVESANSIAELKRTVGGEYGGHYTPERYYKLNFASYVCYGTIEFRHHSGTIEFGKIANWVKLTHKMMERANMRVNVKAYADVDKVRADKQLTSRFLKEVELTGTDVAEYVVKRINSLKRGNEEVA